MNPISEDQLQELANRPIMVRHAPAGSVMTRGRSIRRRRRAGGVAAVAVATVLTTGSASLLLGHDRPGADRVWPAATSASSGAAADYRPCVADRRAKATPADHPEVLYVVDPAGRPAVAGRLYDIDACGGSVSAGVDLGAGGRVERSFLLSGAQQVSDDIADWGPAYQDVEIRGTTGHLSQVTPGRTEIVWKEGGQWWSFVGWGMTRAETVAAAGRLTPDPRDPGNLIAPSDLMDEVVSHGPRAAGTGWDVAYGVDEFDQKASSGGFMVRVTSGWPAEMTPIEAFGSEGPGRIVTIGGHRVVVTPHSVTWADGAGNRLVIDGPITEQQRLDAMAHVIKVSPDDPRITSIFDTGGPVAGTP